MITSFFHAKIDWIKEGWSEVSLSDQRLLISHSLSVEQKLLISNQKTDNCLEWLADFKKKKTI